jgi:tRNA A-37 threonylcarbamoyl transferase component Bud32
MSGEMSPSTPVETVHVFKTPSVCPPTPTKTPSTQKKRKEHTSASSTTATSGEHSYHFGSTTATSSPLFIPSDENHLIRSSKIKRVAVSPSPAPKRKCNNLSKSDFISSTSNSNNYTTGSTTTTSTAGTGGGGLFVDSRQPLHPIQTPFKSAAASAFQSYSTKKKQLGSSKKVFKALQFDEDEDDDIVDDDDFAPMNNNSSGIGFHNNSFNNSNNKMQDDYYGSNAMNTSASSEELFGNDMEDDLESPIENAASPQKRFSFGNNGSSGVFGSGRNIFGSPIKPAVPSISTTPPSPELFQDDRSNFSDSDEDLALSDDEGIEDFSDLAVQTQMESCTPPKFSLSVPMSPPNVTKVACRLTTEDVHQNPFSPERNIKPKARRSIANDLDILNDLPPQQKNEDEKKDKSNCNDSFLIGYFSRYLEDFTEIAVLGDGSFGKVTKCMNRFDGMCYAVKQTKKKIRGNKDRELILKEIHALATLVDNPYIVRYFSGWIEDERLFVQTELCEGGSWSEKLRSGHIFSEDELTDILRQICTGLQQMHAQNIVHLDIKPENIYLTATGKYKIGDLGLAASSLEELKDVNEGDSRYLAKEILNGEHAEYTSELTKVDIFALGASIYESASRRPLPNNGDEWHEIRDGNLKYMQEPEYSREFINLVRSMVHVDPKQRPSSLDILQSNIVRKRKLSYEDLQKQVYVLEEMLRKQKETEHYLRNQLSTGSQ